MSYTIDAALLPGGEEAGTRQALPARILTFCTFALIPFLGGNHCALFYVNIDRFWMEALFPLLLILSLAAVYLGGGRNQKSYLRFCFWFLPFFAINALGILYSWNPFGGLLGCEVLVWAAGAVCLYLLSPGKEVCLAGLVAGAAGSGVAAILQHLVLFPNLNTIFQQGMYAHILREQSAIPFSSYLHHNMLGGYLAFLLPVAVYFALYGKKWITSLSGVGASGLILTGVVLSSSRISMGLVFLGLAGTAGLAFVGRRGTGVIKVSAVVALGLVISFLVFHGGENKKVAGVQGVITQKARTVGKDLSTLNTRTDIWRNASQAFIHKPVLGFGPGAFEYGYRRYFDGGSYTTVAHSTVVKTAVETGIVGLLCLLFYLYGVFRAVRFKEGEPLDRFVLLSVCCGFLFSLIDFSFDVASHVITFFVLTSHFFTENEAETAPPWVRRDSAVRHVIFGTLILVLLGSFLFHNRVNMMRKDIEHGDLFQENGFPVRALDAYREAMTLMPLSAEPKMKGASALIGMAGAEKEAGTAGKMRRELAEYLGLLKNRQDRNGERYLVMGRGYAFLGEGEKARVALSQAIDLYPSSPYYILEIGTYYFSTGRPDLAIRTIRTFDPYIPKFRTPHNPRGIFVYRIRDLEASILFSTGNREGALRIARENLKDAREGVFVITSSRSRNYVVREAFLPYLEEKVRFYENN